MVKKTSSTFTSCNTNHFDPTYSLRCWVHGRNENEITIEGAITGCILPIGCIVLLP